MMPTDSGGEDKACVLIVDDEPRVVRTLSRLLSMQFTVLQTSDPAEALSLVKENLVHVVVSDQRMPKITGVQLLKKIALLSPLTTRILLTGYSDLEAVMSSINESEIYRYITKPWSNKALTSEVGLAAQLSVQLREEEANAAKIGEEETSIEYVGENSKSLGELPESFEELSKFFANTAAQQPKSTDENPPLSYAPSKPIDESPTLEYELSKPIDESPTLEYELSKPIDESPTLDHELSKPIDESPTLEYELSKPIDESPTLEYELSKPIDESPTFDVKLSKLINESPTLNDELSKPIDESPTLDHELAKPIDESPTLDHELAKPIDGSPTLDDELSKTADASPMLAEASAKSFDNAPARSDEIFNLFDDAPPVLINKSPTHINKVKETSSKRKIIIWQEDTSVGCVKYIQKYVSESTRLSYQPITFDDRKKMERFLDVGDNSYTVMVACLSKSHDDKTYRFLKRLKREYPYLVTIVLTPEACLEEAVAIINNCRAYRYLASPTSFSQFKLSFGSALEHQQRVAKSYVLRNFDNAAAPVEIKHSLPYFEVVTRWFSTTFAR